MKDYIKPPRLTTSFSKNGLKAKKRFANILDARGKKRGVIALALTAAAALSFSGCFAKEKATPNIAEKSGINVVVAGSDSAGSDLILLCSLTDGKAEITHLSSDAVNKTDKPTTPRQLLSAVSAATGADCEKYVIIDLDSAKRLAADITGADLSTLAEMSRGELYKKAADALLNGGVAAKLPELINETAETNLSAGDIADIARQALKLKADDVTVKSPSLDRIGK